MQRRPRTPQLNNRERKRHLWIFLFKSIYKFGHCYWCERRLQFESATFDHNPPLSKNGDRDRGVISCYACNHSQRNKSRPSSPDYIQAMKEDEIEQAWKSYRTPKRDHVADERAIIKAWENSFYV